jgi:hypothetical protein
MLGAEKSVETASFVSSWLRLLLQLTSQKRDAGLSAGYMSAQLLLRFLIMTYHRNSLIFSAILVVIVYGLLYPSSPKMASQRKYTAQHGFFSHDEDPESWEFRATTRVNLGLLERSYPTDVASGSSLSQEDSTQWQRFHRYIRHLNANNANIQYKLLYLIRHGEGLHNVKEREVGRAEWDVSFISHQIDFCVGNEARRHNGFRL